MNQLSSDIGTLFWVLGAIAVALLVVVVLVGALFVLADKCRELRAENAAMVESMQVMKLDLIRLSGELAGESRVDPMVPLTDEQRRFNQALSMIAADGERHERELLEKRLNGDGFEDTPCYNE